MNYILKHWLGEYSLAKSFWVNVFLISIGIRVLQAWFYDVSPIENPVVASQVTIAYIFIAIAMVYPWQIIGLWRSASRHSNETQNNLWPVTVKVLVVIGVIATFGNVKTSWPLYKEMYKIGFKKDSYSNYRVELTENGKLIHLQGGMGFGVSKDVAKLIEQNPNVEGIILDSIGGRLYEGREISKIIMRNGFDTYTLKGCYSACVTAFISGNKRYLAKGSNLAFHQYSSGAKILDPYVDIPAEQKKDIKIYKIQGINKNFIRRIFKAKNNDLWYPTIEEMLSAGVVHEVVKPSMLRAVEYGSLDRGELDDVLKDIPAFKAIKKYEPDMYDKIVIDMQDRMKNGESILEVEQEIGGYIELLASKALPRTSDKALIMFVRETLNTLELLENKEPILCIKNLYPDKYGALDMTKHLTNEEMMPMLNALNNVIVDSYEQVNTKTDVASAEDLMARVISQLGDNAEYLDPKGLQNNEEYSTSCNTVIRFYELILENDKKSTGNALRYAFSP